MSGIFDQVINYNPITAGTTTAYVKGEIAKMVNPRSSRGGVAFDGTASTRVFSTLTGQAIATDSFSLSVTFRVPATAGADTDVIALSSSATTTQAASSFAIGYTGTGALQVYIVNGAASATRNATIAGFISSYAGKVVNVIATRSANVLTIYINGVLTSYSDTGGGTGINWSDTVSSTYLLQGFRSSSVVSITTIYSASFYNLALAQADVAEIYELGGAVPERYKFGSQVAATNGTFTGQQYETFTGASAAGFTAVDSVTSLSFGLSAISRLPEGAVLRTRFTATLTSGVIPTIGVSEAGVAVRSALTTIAAGANSIDILTTSAGASQVQFSTGTLTSYAISGFAAYRLGAVVHFDGDLGGRGLTWYDSSTNGLNATLTATGVTWTKPSLGSPLVSSSITSPAATDLTLAGGTAGSSAVKVTNTTAATSTTTGSLQTAGGLGVAGAGWFGGKVVVGSASSLNTANLYSYGTLKVGGAANQATGTIILGDDQSDQANIGIYRGTTAMALGTGNWLNLAGYDGVNITAGAAQFGSQTKAMALTSSAVSIPLATASTSTTTGALQVAGGVGVAGAGYFGNIVTAPQFNSTGLGNNQFDGVIRFSTPTTVGNAGQVWTGGNGTTGGFFNVPTGATFALGVNNIAQLTVSGSASTFTGLVSTPAATTTTAGLRVPHGAAPTSPVNGDIWTTTAGLFVRINGVTVGPLS